MNKCLLGTVEGNQALDEMYYALTSGETLLKGSLQSILASHLELICLKEGGVN